MIIDCILYNGEAECLQIRWHELKGTADRFVVVESKHTFTGKPKETGDLPFLPGIHHGVAGIDQSTSDPWQREAAQRYAMLYALADLNLADTDIILLGDADEIPNAEAVKVAAELALTTGAQVAFDQTLCTYYVNVVCKNMRWNGTQAIRYDKLKAMTPQGVRDRRNSAPYTMEHAGWHFSSLVLDDPVGRMTAKIQAFSHQECNRPEILAPSNIRRRVAMCEDIQGRTDVQFEIRRDAVLPQYVMDNKGKLSLLYYPGSI